MELCLNPTKDIFRNNHCFYERKVNHDTIEHVNTYWKAVQMKMWYLCHSLGLLIEHWERKLSAEIHGNKTDGVWGSCCQILTLL